MTEHIIIKKNICVQSENEELIKINLIVKTLNSKQYILEIFDSKGRHFVSYNNDYTEQEQEQVQVQQLFDIKNLDICFQREYNFEKRKNDIWIEIHICHPIHIYILNQELDEYCLETIENKIQSLTYELELLKERNNLLKKTYYSDTQD